MLEYGCLFQINPELKSLARPLEFCWEIQTGPEYISMGCRRCADEHGIVHYCLSGLGRIRMGNRFYDIHPGEAFLCIINNSDMDYFFPPESDLNWRFIWFSYIGGDSRELTAELTHCGSPVFRADKNLPEIRRFEQWRNAGKKIVEMDPFEAETFVHSFLAGLWRQRRKERESETPHIIRETLRMIEKNASVSVKEIADRLGLSREYLSRCFHGWAGKTLKDYLMDEHIRQAKLMLMDKTLPIGTISELCGFANTSGFIKMFRRIAGESPGSFRQKQKNKNSTFLS